MSPTPADPPAHPEQFQELLRYLKRNRGFDFSGYKEPSLMRRMLKRMEIVRVDTFDRYIDYLEVHPEEFALLFNHLLINVTAFFRDPPAWDYLRDSVLPKIVENKRSDEPIRVWSAGCASGHEPYSLSMLFAELVGMEAFQERVKVYASDLDEDALRDARLALYSTKDVAAVPKPLLDKYFEMTGDRYQVKTELRRGAIFGRHDLVTDAPISRLDLLVCRNVLMYFNAETQNHILRRFHFALNDTGFLFLGKAEMLLTHASLFQPVELKHRIFTKVAKVTLRDRLLVFNQTGDEEAGHRLTRQLRMRETAFEMAPVPQLVVDVDGNLALANNLARAMFSLAAQDLGRPFRDMEVSYRPVELRGPVEQAYSQRTPVQLSDVQRVLSTGAVQQFTVDIVPLLENSGTVLGANITFHEVTKTVELRAELQRSKQELETAYEELQSTNEELETTNEELQSTVEELETTNEELQSTNEELETMNEELQSTNEELQTVNTELRDRTDELQRANALQESILAGIASGVAVLDEHLSVLMWNQQSQDLWGLRADEVKGRSFIDLDIGLPVREVMAPVRTAMRDGGKSQTVFVQAVNRRGRAFVCRVSCSALRDGIGSACGVIVLMEEAEGRAATSTA